MSRLFPHPEAAAGRLRAQIVGTATPAERPRGDALVAFAAPNRRKVATKPTRRDSVSPHKSSTTYPVTQSGQRPQHRAQPGHDRSDAHPSELLAARSQQPY